MYRGITIQNISRQNKKSYLFLCQHAGTIVTAHKQFVDFIENKSGKKRDELDKFLVMINDDAYLKEIFKVENITQDIILSRTEEIICIMVAFLEESDIKINQIMTNKEVCKQLLKTKHKNKNIDWVVRSYIRQTILKLEDIPIVTKIIKKYDLIKNKNMIHDLHRNINDIYGFNDIMKNGVYHKGLKNIIENEYEDELKIVIMTKEEMKKEKQIQKELELKGKNPDTKVLETEHMLIYNPKTMDQAKYYGRNTKWCTASRDKNKNAFDIYSMREPIFIIEPKNKLFLTEKYQTQISGDLTDDKNDPVNWKWLLENRFNDDEVFKNWVKSKWITPIIDDGNKGVKIKNDLDLLFLSNDKRMNSIIFIDTFNLNVDKNNLPIGVKSIVFGNKFNKKIDNLPETLESITFGEDFDQELDNLPESLESITFGHNFSQGKTEPYMNVVVGAVMDAKEDDEDDYMPPRSKLRRSSGFDSKFNKSLDNLPKSIKNINFVEFSSFELPVNKLPESLEYITFGDSFLDPMSNLPKTLKCVTFSKYYAEQIRVPYGTTTKFRIRV